MIQLNTKSIYDVCFEIAIRVKQRRLELNLTQKGLALRADINIETFRKFERTGNISLENLVKIAFSLNVLDDFEHLFNQKKYQSIDEIISDKSFKRKRGKKQ